jgi:hypothetical protein
MKSVNSYANNLKNHTGYCILYNYIIIYVSFAATCVVDSTMANTFDNTTYPMQLGKCWHVMMTVVPKLLAVPYQQQTWHREKHSLSTLDELSVLVKGVGNNKASIIYD